MKTALAVLLPFTFAGFLFGGEPTGVLIPGQPLRFTMDWGPTATNNPRGPVLVRVKTNTGGDSETVAMGPVKGRRPGKTAGSLATTEGAVVTNNGALEVVLGETITFTHDYSESGANAVLGDELKDGTTFVVVPPEKVMIARFGVPEKDGQKSQESWVTALAFSPDENALAAGNLKGEVVVWDLRTGERTAFVAAHTNRVVAIRYRPDGTAFFTAVAAHSLLTGNSLPYRLIRVGEADESNCAKSSGARRLTTSR